MEKINTVLFDLDGTLLDTATDMANALNQLRSEHALPDIALDDIRPHIGYGSRSLLKLAFGIEQDHKTYPDLLKRFFTAYEDRLTHATALFPEMQDVLTHLEKADLPWGIVTNKPERFTHAILDNLNLSTRSGCIVCGDTLPTRKPHPGTILHACELMNVSPQEAMYVGDAKSDVIASKAAGTQSIVALYGYIGAEENPQEWLADAYIKKPSELMTLL